MVERRIIRGASVLALDGRRMLRRGDVLLEDGVIAAVGGVDAGGALITDAQGVLMPAFVQAYLRVEECLLDRLFVAEPSPRLFGEQTAAWEQALDERARLLLAAAAFARGLSTGTGSFGAAAHPAGLGALRAGAEHFGARLYPLLRAARASELEGQLTPLLAPGARLGLWIDEAERAPRALLEEASRLALRHNLPLFARLVGAPGDRGLLRLERAGAFGKHLAVVSGSGRALADAGLVRGLARAGASVVLTPGLDLLLGAPPPPLALLLEHKVNLALGTGSGATRLGSDPFRELKLLLRLLSGVTAEPASLALEIATRGGAAALHGPHGSLGVGQAADLMLLDVEAHPSDDHELVARRIIVQGERSSVRTLWVHGQVVYSDGKVILSEAPNEEEEEGLREQMAVRCAPRWRRVRGPWAQLLDQFARSARLREGWHAGVLPAPPPPAVPPARAPSSVGPLKPERPRS